MRAIFSSPAEQKFCTFIFCFNIALFPPLVKSKKEHQTFKKHQKQKRCPIRRLNEYVIFYSVGLLSLKKSGSLLHP